MMLERYKNCLESRDIPCICKSCNISAVINTGVSCKLETVLSFFIVSVL